MKYIQYLMILIIIISWACLIYFQNNNTENFSLNMVDDIIHNKYEKNSDEYYIYRNKADEEKLKTEPYNLILYDNLAVWYDHLWDLDRALEIYKTKKILLENKTEDIDNLYRYHANIWTFFIHDGIKKWFKNKEDLGAQLIIIDWKNHIKKAIELNKEAHFWRENYQLIAIENLIKSFDNSEQLIEYNLLWKNTLDDNRLMKKWDYYSCWEEYHDIYPEVKKVGKSKNEQILDSCPMTLKWLVWMVRFGGWPNPYTFVTIWDILTTMWEYNLAVASYFRAIELQHPNSINIKEYINKLSYTIYWNMDKNNSYELLYNQYKSDLELWTQWSNNYVNFQKEAIKNNGDPRNINIYNNFYKEYNYPQNIKYNRK